MNTTSTEHTATVLDVQGCKFGSIYTMDNGLISNQKVSVRRHFTDEFGKHYMTVKMRFDDDCGNGHETFSIIADIVSETGKWECGGCLHDEISIVFPEFAPLIKWHLTSTDGPMHYPVNAVFLAGNRDCWGRQAGEVSGSTYAVKFGRFPITHKVNSGFAAFLKDHPSVNWALSAFEVQHVREPATFGPKYGIRATAGDQVAQFPENGKWHLCPFDELAFAQQFCKAWSEFPATVVSIPTAYSDGKVRELDRARNSAVWPEATDEELSQPSAQLKEVLMARLPQLMADFREAMTQIGFVLPKVWTEDGAPTA